METVGWVARDRPPSPLNQTKEPRVPKDASDPGGLEKPNMLRAVWQEKLLGFTGILGSSGR